MRQFSSPGVGVKSAPALSVRDVAWTAFAIPVRGQFHTGHGATRLREGVLVRLTTADGVGGHGEASPTAAFGGGAVRDVVGLLRHTAPALRGRDVEAAFGIVDALPKELGASSLACALDTALLDIVGKTVGARVAELLLARSGADRPPADVVPVNATVAEPETSRAAATARAAVAHGFRCVKLKVGVAATTRAEVERVAAVRAAIGPAAALRLDANGAWTALRAMEVLEACAPYDLDMVEQPVARDDLDGLRRVRERAGSGSSTRLGMSTTGRASSGAGEASATQPLSGATCLSPERRVRIAADEAAFDVDAIEDLLAGSAVDTVVVKPMVIGSLRTSRRVLDLVQAAPGIGAIVTTTIDAGIGAAAALHLAAGLRGPLPYCGLATGPLLEADLLRVPLRVRHGAMDLPRGAGLGVEVDEDQLRRYAVGGESSVWATR